MAPLKPINPPIKLYEEYCSSKAMSMNFPQTMARVNECEAYNFFDSDGSVVFKTVGLVTSGTQKSFSDREGNPLFDISEIPDATGGVKYKAITPTGEVLCTVVSRVDVKMKFGFQFTNRATNQPMELILRTSSVPLKMKLYLYNGKDVVAKISNFSSGISKRPNNMMIEVAPNLDCTIPAILGAVFNAKIYNFEPQYMPKLTSSSIRRPAA